MSSIQIPEKIITLCDENPEINIFESGEGIHIISNDFNPNFKLFIIYNPFNKGSKILNPILFNKCVSFTLTSLDSDKMDIALMLYKSMKINRNDKNIWAQISLIIAQSHIFCVEKSNELIDNFAGGISFTSRNLNFIIEDKNNNNFKDKGISK